MNPLNLTRVVMGVIILGGLVFYTPLAYATAGMMVIAGLTGA